MKSVEMIEINKNRGYFEAVRYIKVGNIKKENGVLYAFTKEALKKDISIIWGY